MHYSGEVVCILGSSETMAKASVNLGLGDGSLEVLGGDMRERLFWCRNDVQDKGECGNGEISVVSFPFALC